MTKSRSATHFERLYQSSLDPWDFGTSPYEQSKYRQTLSALGDRHFKSGLEIGCSIGILTRLLALRCDMILGLDIVEAPLQAARTHCVDHPHVRFQRTRVPAEWPHQSFDLIVFSEVLYFLAPADIDYCANRVQASLLPNTTVILVNWLGPTDDPTNGDEAAKRFIDATAGMMTVTRHDRYEGYRLDVLQSACV
jgi:2-polyprenyl-3-methyl-5-hydroxy-6-metoxy-1,4-benzoquinol methylase